jgi:hypothetical protein
MEPDMEQPLALAEPDYSWDRFADAMARICVAGVGTAAE